MLQNAMVVAFTISKLFKKNQQRRGGVNYSSPPRLGLKKSSVKAKYCFPVTELESLSFMFKKGLRLADFSLFVTWLKEITIWVFSLDHTHHERWVLAFIEDVLAFYLCMRAFMFF